MKLVTNNNKQFILDRIKNIILLFTDDTKITLSEITDFNLDLDSINCSEIDITNALFNKELQNHFKGYKKNKIKEIWIEGIGFSLDDCKGQQILYDIPCNMYIRRLIINGNIGTSSSMQVVLEGSIN